MKKFETTLIPLTAILALCGANCFADTALCTQVKTMVGLALLENNPDITELRSMKETICEGGQGNQQGSIFYSNGGYAYVGSGFQDSGSWKWSNGNSAFVGPAYSDHGTWYYLNGNCAFVGPYYRDAGEWNWPNGNVALVGPAYSNHGSWYYPNGNSAFVGPYYQDAGSWKWPNGNVAFVGPAYSDHGTWYYPNGNTYSTGGTGSSLMLVEILEAYQNTEYPNDGEELDSLPEAVQNLLRLNWVYQTAKQ